MAFGYQLAGGFSLHVGSGGPCRETRPEFAKVVEGVPAIVVAAGGPKADNPLDVLRQAASVVAAGGYGVTSGRNVWGAADPGKMVRALRAVVHEGEHPETAAKLLA